MQALLNFEKEILTRRLGDEIGTIFQLTEGAHHNFSVNIGLTWIAELNRNGEGKNEETEDS